MENVSKKNFEVPTSCSVPGFTATQDSEKFELYVPDAAGARIGRCLPGRDRIAAAR